MAATHQTETELFQSYLEVCNQALEANKDRFPYKQMLEASEKLLGAREITVAVYDDQPKAVYDLALSEKHLSAKPHESECQKAWRLNRSYLEEVVNHAEDYIKNPAKIDWAWLKSQM